MKAFMDQNFLLQTETAQKLYDELTGLQWGDKPDPFGWTKVVGE